ncbi:MAG: glucose 1-dehydrogenase [Rhizomicrobium sp.]
MATRFAGKTAIVSGGARGQGAAEARMLVEEGARVVIGDILEREGMALAADLGDKARFVPLDVTKEEDWRRVVATAQDLGPVRCLINNAGIFTLKPIIETEAALFEQYMRVNQLGVFLGMKASFAAMKAAGGGAMVNISSVAGLHGLPNGIAYASTKWAVRGMSKVAAAEFGPSNIRVNSVHPGLVDTEMTAFIAKDQREAYTKELPLRRRTTIEEVAKCVLYLLSDDAATITGAEVKIDSGSLL